jgi:hypothetical protein
MANLRVIICEMRRLRTWINMVAMLALLMGIIPGSVFASSSSGGICTLACCVGKPAHHPDDPECLRECDEDQDHHSGDHHDSSVVASQAPSPREVQAPAERGTDCKCTIRSAPVAPESPVLGASSSSLSTQILDADVQRVATIGDLFSLPVVCAGIYGADPGPPVSRPKYASLGRAPPVLLA